MSKALICFPAWFDMVMWRFVMLKQISKNEHFRNLVQLALDNNVLFQHILADSWFGSMANMYFIHHDLNKHFIFAIKSNRCVALSKRSKLRSISMSRFFRLE
jgi:hypothetical protein